MFKQFALMIIFIVFSYLVTKYILRKNYRRFYFINGIIKYPLTCKIKNSSYTKLSEIKDLNNIIFYTKEKLNIENYIYDKNSDYYYLIEPGYYYYIKNKENIDLHFNSNSYIFLLKLK
jgi:hypothetical protein